MQASLEQLVKTAIKNQAHILQCELEKGVPLNYFDENGEYCLHHPDGKLEKSCLKPIDIKSCNQDSY